MKPIVVVGSINMDLVSRTPRIPAPGETIIGTSFATHPGGKGANQAVAVARLGAPCTMLGKVGDDVFGKALLEGLQREGVDTSHIETEPSVSSGTATIAVDDNAENCIIVTPGANDHVSVAYLEQRFAVLRGAAMVLIQLEIPIETVDWLGTTCRKLGVPLILDPAPARKLPESLLSTVSWFTPNEGEASFYADGLLNEHEILDSLFASGLQRVILKRGGRGSILADGPARPQQIDVFPVTARDTTAAGDAFNGAFAVGLLRGLPAAESARFASAAAAVSVTRVGAQASMATLPEVQKLLGTSLALHVASEASGV